jgi:hypothetical protein
VVLNGQFWLLLTISHLGFPHAFHRKISADRKFLFSVPELCDRLYARKLEVRTYCAGGLVPKPLLMLAMV